jgi:hypothetical protein
VTAPSFERLATRRRRSYGPWSADHVNRVVTGNAAGLLLVGASWWRVSGTGSVREQVGWMVAAIAGVGLAAMASGSWLLRGMQSVSAGRDLVLPSLTARRRSTARTPASAVDDAALVTVPGTRRYHRADCAMVRGKAVVVPSGVGPDGPLGPCEVCLS